MFRTAAPRSPALSGGDSRAFVEAVYRLVLRRPADATGLAAFSDALSAGVMTPLEILRHFEASDEHQVLLAASSDGYDPAADPQLAPFRTPEAQALTARLFSAGEVDLEAFDRLHAAAMTQVDEETRVYLVMHRQRFRELFQAVAVLRAGKPSPRLLEVGSCVVTPWWPQLVPGVRVSVMNRPTSPLVHVPNVECEAFCDLNLEPPVGPEVLGRFDVIVFTEVLEHLTAHAPTLLAGLLALLEPEGALYITTPNIFRREKLEGIRRRVNPQPPFPRSNADTHHHMREYAMGELLGMVAEAGGAVRAWGFSTCWDYDSAVPEHERMNMVVVAGRAG